MAGRALTVQSKRRMPHERPTPSARDEPCLHVHTACMIMPLAGSRSNELCARLWGLYQACDAQAAHDGGDKHGGPASEWVARLDTCTEEAQFDFWGAWQRADVRTD
jgi:hypothetical protein